MGRTCLVFACPLCCRPWPGADAEKLPVDTPAPVAVEVVHEGRRKGERPGLRGGSGPGSTHLGQFYEPHEVSDDGTDSFLQYVKERLVHVAELLDVVLERRVEVEVDRRDLLQRAAVLEAALQRATRPEPILPRASAKGCVGKGISERRATAQRARGARAAGMRDEPVAQFVQRPVVSNFGARPLRAQVRGCVGKGIKEV